MMYELIQISKINDFLFCPYSIYLHSIYDSFHKDMYQRRAQHIGTIRHKNVDTNRYSSSKYILQGIPIYCNKYRLIGKLDLFDCKKGYLVERKYKLKGVYDGYKYQLYAQMFCLEEMNYKVKKIFLHSISDNKRYPIELPNKKEILKFESVLNAIWNYSSEKTQPNEPKEKCKNCIYSQLCEFSKC